MDMEQLRSLSSQATERLAAKADHIEGGPSASPAPKADPAPAAAAPKADPAPEAAISTPSQEAIEPADSPTPGKPNAAAAAVSAASEPVIPAVEEAPAYKPNYKYKIGEESREIPEQLRTIMKDPTSEAFVRDLITKADGLPIIKQQNQEIKSAYGDLHGKHSTLNEGLAELGSHIKRKDFGSFFDTLKVDRRDVFAWVMQEAQKQQALAALPPEQQAYVHQQEQQAQQARLMEMGARDQETRFQEQAHRTRTLELQLVASQPDIQSFASQFDARAGQPNAFFREVAAVGQLAWNNEGRDLSAQEAVQRVVQRFQPWLGGAPAQGAPVVEAAPPQGSAPAATVARKAPPVIPSIAGGSTSPTKAAPKNLNDLKKLASEASARLAARSPN